METIFETLRNQEQVYTSGYTKKGKYVQWSMYDTIQTIDAYLSSTHISGSTDSLGREKPFFNIVTAACNVWYRTTDLDRKDINFIPTATEQTILALAATILIQEWMNREKFGHFLNEWGRTLAKYGSAVVKFTKKEGRLIPSVVPWSDLIVDSVNFDSAPVIEKFYLTPSELRQRENYDQETVENLLAAQGARENLEGQQIDTKGGYVEIYEIHGNLSQAVYKHAKGSDVLDGDEKIFFPQMHVVSYVATETEGEYQDFSLYVGKETKSPYMITHLIEESGRTLGMGAVEYLFDAQWMVNHSMKLMKDYLDIASRQIFQTSDANFVGRNVLSAIETGDIMIHRENMPLTQINNSALNIAAIQNFGIQWVTMSRELTSTPDAIRGNTQPSGTPYSLGAILQQQAGSLFEIMTENKGLYLEDMFREFVIPYFKTKLDTSEEITAILDERKIAQLDAIYVPHEAVKRFNERSVDAVLRLDSTKPPQDQSIPSPFQADIEQNNVRQELARVGNLRGIKPSDIKSKTWKRLLKDFEWKIQIQVTNEVIDKQAVLQTLSTVLQTIASNPQVLQDPNAKMLLGKILQQTSIISPIELSAPRAIPTPMPAPMPEQKGNLPIRSLE